MSYNDYCLSKSVAQVEEKLVDVLFCMAVKIAGWLIGEDYRRMVDDGPGYGHSLLLASGEFGRLVRCPVAISAGIMTFSSAVNSGRRWWN